MVENWFKFTVIGYADEYGFGTVAEAVKFANAVNADRAASHCTPYLLSAEAVACHGLGRRTDVFMLRDALRARLDRCQARGAG